MSAPRASSADALRDELAADVEAVVAAVADDPSERLAMRARFYARHARGVRHLGNAEIEFTRWLLARAVLVPVADGGSAWWRRVQARLMRDGELASLLFTRGIRSDRSPSVDNWLRFLARPDARAWYRAHNASVVLGYGESLDDVLSEPVAERRLVRVVLARILFAQAMIEGEALGPLGVALADPRAASIRTMLERSALYPRAYPATDEVAAAPLARLESTLVATVDRHVIGRRFDLLVARAAVWLGVPALPAIARGYRAAADARGGSE